ncbi:sigma factor-like helix-turn-helix DNA-binding protein [Luteibacter yeojuensis]|uniref:RNA polymerase sigma factor 70 region 4 type 2 domain-containing protein n=1 Tax=Luteibacter yeojuensis TaxID=345309 RepID=A0A7X5QT68_9GAMM|nr:sigma factor-like helix-turn-helix DNA-binding protein [Luteibacter yeojuensis]NID14934.1 hypothetical protein [Luteibacter yeojuensis]
MAMSQTAGPLRLLDMDPHTTVYESLRRQLSTRQPVDSVLNGLLDALDGLPPDARVAFLMSDIFEAGIDEVAMLLRRDAGACRELLHDARSYIQAAGSYHARPQNEDLP